MIAMDESSRPTVSSNIPGSPAGKDTETRRSRTNSRVHFPEDVHDSEIKPSTEQNSMIDVHLGFLQTNHIYEVHFTVGDSVPGPVTTSIDRQVVLKSVEAFPTQNESGHDIVLRLLGHKDGIIHESFKLTSKTNLNQTVTILLHTKLLGKDQGTPLLKDGIHAIGHEGGPDDSDMSDASNAAD